jgi:hypothetical protein
MLSESSKKHLHSLPLEVLQQIANYLNYSHRPSLDTFALTSKTCHNATLSLIFDHVRLTISTLMALQRDVNTLAKALSRTDSTSHVRRLSIKGVLTSLGQSSTEEERDQGWHKSRGLNRILGNDENDHSRRYVVYDTVI